MISRRRRQAIPSTADFIIVMGGKTQQATLTGLKPYTNYRVVVKAFNTGGEGPASAVMIIETLEGGKCKLSRCELKSLLRKREVT